MEPRIKKRPKGAAQIRKEKRGGIERWGYEVWLRQPDGSRVHYREFSFGTKAEAQQALAALRTAGWKARYAVNPPETIKNTTIKEAADSYIKLAQATLLSNRTEDSTYWRDTPGHLHALERFVEFMGPTRHVTSISKDDFIFWIAA